MKLRKSLLTLILLIFFQNICFAQNQTNSKIVDEFGKLSNDDLQGRVWQFTEILNQNKSYGTIVLFGEKKYPLATYINERRIQGCLSYLKVKTDRLSFIFTDDKDEVGGQFWESPNPEQKPSFSETPHDYRLSNLAKPYLIYRFNESIADEFCPLYFDMEYYSRFLKANPNIIGKIVIREKSADKFQKERLKYLRQLTRKEKVSPKQINIVRGKFKNSSDTEFWLVPLKRKTAETAQR